MIIKTRKKRISSIGLISFTDVIFLLLIFLLISSNFITHSGIKVDLPGSNSQQNEYNKNISLTLTKNNEIFINNEAVGWEELPEVLNRKLIEDPEQVVVVRADETVELKNVVKLLDIAKLSGTNRFFIATEIQVEDAE
ncbi:MAG: biopolymer transporter ExbD [Candidatus Cloacimonetes bacterium]|jgi:biopolymer transport protein ExbD|nr:biopolymer transporter ExbD [Candidatus Cloacimonadota bacterium]MBT4576178.1 biopolymer transporter ExbD [Candidatus Cloacimonadota bacterium]